MFQYLFRSLWPALQESELKLPLGASKVPKNGKMCPKIAKNHRFGHLRGPLVAISAQILVEQVISFEMSTETSKSDKN